MSDPGHDYFDSEKGGIAQYDQLKAEAMSKLRGCDSFVLCAGFVDDDDPSGMTMKVIAGVKTPFAPYFLAQAAHGVTKLPIEAIEDLAGEFFDESSEPDAEA